MSDRDHAQAEMLAGRRDRLSSGDWHRLRECAGHDAGTRSPLSGSEADGVRFDIDVGCIDEHRTKVFDLLIDAARLMTVRQGHHDVLGMALAEPAPLLTAKYFEVQHVVHFEFLLDPLY